MVLSGVARRLRGLFSVRAEQCPGGKKNSNDSKEDTSTSPEKLEGRGKTREARKDGGPAC